MFEKNFQLNDETLQVVEHIGQHMPGGFFIYRAEGDEAAEKIRALDRPYAREVPIIAMTANAFDEDVQRSLQVGMTAHLSKPVEPERLYETLDKLIHAPR